jgi:hypothetical protein
MVLNSAVVKDINEASAEGEVPWLTDEEEVGEEENSGQSSLRRGLWNLTAPKRKRSFLGDKDSEVIATLRDALEVEREERRKLEAELEKVIARLAAVEAQVAELKKKIP